MRTVFTGSGRPGPVRERSAQDRFAGPLPRFAIETGMEALRAEWFRSPGSVAPVLGRRLRHPAEGAGDLVAYRALTSSEGEAVLEFAGELAVGVAPERTAVRCPAPRGHPSRCLAR